MSDKVLVSLENGIKRITFNNPARRNALDFDAFKYLTEIIQQSAEDETKVIVLTGAGDSFCAGADLQGFGGDTASHDVTASLRSGINPGIQAMRELPKPIIARVHGHAAGVGCNYALAADIIIASDQAFFGQVFVKIGLMPDGGGTHFLPRAVGYNRAFELMALGDSVAAQAAYEMGMINRVVPVAELDLAVNALAERLAASPGVALGRIKAGLNAAMQSDLASALDFEAVNQGVCFRSEDFKEGVSAFLRKRKPEFKGR
ncbi:MAG: enoyl-CoA hydratase [Acidobacteriota bacterium]|nr:enoyl-CoA hydratase [Acidobacteriota bacterium]